jgi:DNA-binding NarL/FixJ family response regulator
VHHGYNDGTGAPIAIADVSPARRRGIAAALEEAGHEVHELEAPAALVEWLRRPGDRAAVLCALEPAGRELLRRAREADADAVLVALVEGGDARAIRTALMDGATAAASVDAPLDELTQVVGVALAGKVVLDAPVAEALARGCLGPELLDCAVSDPEVDWLRGLARGDTVAELAEAAAFSEREMYRQLGALYERLGAANRTQAIVRAAQLGLIDAISGDADDGSGPAGRP